MQLVFDVAVGRVQLGGDFVFDEGLIQFARGREAAAAGEMLLRRAQFGALERQPRVGVGGTHPNRFRVFDDGEIEVLTPLGVGTAAKGAGARAARGQQAERQPRGEIAEAGFRDEGEQRQRQHPAES